jgi:hypothetical protein
VVLVREQPSAEADPGNEPLAARGGLEAGEMANALALPRHDRPQNLVDASGIPLAILLEPVHDIAVRARGHQYLGRAPELG